MGSPEEMKLAILRETLQENVGMSSYEADVYLALVRGGPQTMSDLASSSGVPKQRVYDTVEDLRDEGFVEIIDDYPRKAYAVEPAEALSDIQDQLARAEEYLEEFHETVENVEHGVALFKSERTIQKYIKTLIEGAENDVFLLCPVSLLEDVSEYLATCESQQVRVIISNLQPESLSSDELEIDELLPKTVDAVRGVTSTEDLVLTTDLEKGFYWSRTKDTQDDEEQGFYISTPKLALMLDRFVSGSVWPFARSLSTRTPSLPTQYVRIRDCLSDLTELSNTYPLDSIEVEFEGYDNQNGKAVHETGTLSSYYFTEFDIRSSITIDVGGNGDEVESPLVTVGGRGSQFEDYSAHTITLRKVANGETTLNEETRKHLRACQRELPNQFGRRSVVTGFDAFIDRMREIIGEWSDGYERVRQFDEFRESVLGFQTSESAPRIEWTQTRTEAGGHVAHTGRVFDALGYDVTLLGQLGIPVRSEFSREFRDQSLVSVGETTHTDFVQFNDRKLLFTEPNVNPLTWESVLEHVDISELTEYFDGASLLTLATLHSTPTLPSLLEGLRTELWPSLDSPPENIHFATGAIDRFPASKVKQCYEELAALDEIVPVTVTANRQQTRQLKDIYDGISGTYEKPTVQRVREQTGVTRYIMHTNSQATLASEDGVIAAQAPPRVKPRRERNVDEHFVSGVALALAENMSNESMLILGNSVARYFMRHKQAPNADELRSFISEYDAFFDE